MTRRQFDKLPQISGDTFAHPSRRDLLGSTTRSLGAAALTSLLPRGAFGEPKAATHASSEPALPHFPPTAKRAIFLFMADAPSQIDTFDYKPAMADMFDKDIPPSVLGSQRLTTMTSGQDRFPLAPTIYKFKQHGKSGAWVSELLPNFARVVDDVAFIKSVNTDHINHDPAITFIQTGNQLPGRPCLGSWLSYGLGSENKDLPSYVVLHSKWSAKRDAQALFSRLWGAGYLPSKHQGVTLRSDGDPVLFLSNPPGMDRGARKDVVDAVAWLNQRQLVNSGDPEISARVSQYEMAFRMQASVPELTDMSKESDATYALYGSDARVPGTFAYNCLMARRLAERDVRFVQIFHRGWDQHDNLPRDLPLQCKDVDQACAALITDLKQRGLLDDTLVIWGGEFGRTIYCQGKLTRTNFGRDHHPRCNTMWMAGGGVKAGVCHGETDEFSYNIVRDPVHIRDLNATILRCLGVDHERLTFKYQGLDQKLTGVVPAHVTKSILI